MKTVKNGKLQDINLYAKAVGHPIGFIYQCQYDETSYLQLRLNGSLVNRQTYADLWNYILKHPSILKTEEEWQQIAVSDEGYCRFFSSGDNSTTFRLPKYPNSQLLDNKTDYVVQAFGYTDKSVDLSQENIEQIIGNQLENNSFMTKTEADNTYLLKSEKGTSIATLEGGKIPLSQIPDNLVGGGDVDLSDYVTKTELSEKGYITNAALADYATTEALNTGLQGKADTSALANYVTNEALEGKGYLTTVPAEYITETELNSKNYATTTALNTKLNKTEVANKANKIPRFTADGHLIIPANNIEIW